MFICIHILWHTYIIHIHIHICMIWYDDGTYLFGVYFYRKNAYIVKDDENLCLLVFKVTNDH